MRARGNFNATHLGVMARERDHGCKALPEFYAFFCELLTKFVANGENEKNGMGNWKNGRKS